MSRSLHLVEPPLRPLLAGRGGEVLDNAAVALVREQERRVLALRPPPSRIAGILAERVFVPGDLGGVPVEVLTYRPAARAVRPALLHIHGGGFVFGSAHDHDLINQHLAMALDCVVASVEYRRAPEAPHPAALLDCHAALCWLAGAASTLGIDPDRIVVTGDSAGGGLAASLCQLARDAGGPRIAAQILTYPMLDDRTSDDPDPNPYAGEFLWTRQHNRYAWSALLGRRAGDPPPHAVPARTTNLSGLPPATLFVGALDLFIDEAIDYARRLARDGVPVGLRVYPGAYHGFDLVAGAVATGDLGRARLEAWRRALHPETP